MSEKDTKLRIVSIAEELFYRKGYKATTTRDIAKMANINISMINYHFRTKEDLYIEIIKKINPILALIYNDSKKSGSIHNYINISIAECFRNPRIIHIFLYEQFQSSSPRIKKMIDQIEQEHFEHYQSFFRCSKENDLDEKRIQMTYYSIFGLFKEIFGFQSFKNNIEKDELIKMMTSFIDDKILGTKLWE
ncbi:TetR/AcrR family transcriptional regulator [Chryseobacterium terrae]|uniref:TetR/AcrR family transcriptional regulator n=1 Tax=Chryseobacterium terrae TaxID=3163299 RepID=A0ABW8Y2T5_9FLAO